VEKKRYNGKYEKKKSTIHKVRWTQSLEKGLARKKKSWGKGEQNGITWDIEYLKKGRSRGCEIYDPPVARGCFHRARQPKKNSREKVRE